MDNNKNNKSEISNSDLRYKQLQEFDADIDWRQLVDLIVNPYVESGICKLQIPVETLIRIYFLQLRYSLSARETAIALTKIDVLRDFAIIDTNTDVFPEEECIDTFMSLVELNDLKNQFAEAFNIEPIQQKKSIFA